MAHLKKVKTRLAIHAHRKVTGLLDGQYASLHQGRSLDFADLREYVVGDDVKDIDWRATARHGKPLVKRYVADRKHTVMLTIATGRSMAGMATLTEPKSEVALMAAGVMGYLATRHGDRVGLSVVSGDQAEVLRPSQREVDVERMLVHAESMCTVESPEADPGALLAHTVAAGRRRNIVVLILDDEPPTPDEEALLARLVAQHQVLLFTVGDLDPSDPSAREKQLWDMGKGTPIPRFVQGDTQLATQLEEAASRRLEAWSRMCTRLGVVHEHLESTDGVIGAVLRMLERTRHAARG